MRSLLRLLPGCLAFALVLCAAAQPGLPDIIAHRAAGQDAADKDYRRPSPAELKELVARVAATEREFRMAREHYTYRQTFEFIEEGGGAYRAVTDVTFTPEGKRLENALKAPINTLKRILLTEQDFRDLAEVQPFVLDPEDLWNYEVTYLEEQTLRGIPTFTLRIRPRQTFEGQRLFDGVIWATREGLQVIQLDGRAVPNLLIKGKENLFPRFTTTREKIDGQNWFPALTVSDDVLEFASGPVRVHFTVKYAQYRRFQAESRIQYK